MDRERSRLLEHVRKVQAEVRSCEGCGLCCTEAYNSVRILPFEARRIARHLRSLEKDRREALGTRIREAILRFRLRARPERQAYTCPFLEPDFSCALPFDVKPVACLAFNPVTRERCEMEVSRFDAAHESATRQNQAAGLALARVPIPVAVLTAMDQDRGPEPRDAGRGGSDDRRHPLPRLLSKWHVAPRRKAEELVRAGRVTVNGAAVRDVVRMVDPERDRIAVDGTEVRAPAPAAYAYVLLNKPRGVVTTTSDPEGRATVMDALPDRSIAGLAPVGRLDRDSAGALLLTNDHELAARLLDPATHVRKVYRVKVRGHVSPETLERMRTERVEAEGVRFEPFRAEVESVGPRSTWLRLTLEEGKNRQIRKQCAAFGHEVELIVRMKFGPLELGALKPGAWRALTPPEVESLRKAPS